MGDKHQVTPSRPATLAAGHHHPQSNGTGPAATDEAELNVASIHWAIDNAHDELVVQLCEGGASLNACDANGWTALHWAAKSGRVQLVGYLVEHGAFLEAKNLEGRTPLHIAAMHGHEQAIYVLLHFGADETATDGNSASGEPTGWTALHWAAASGHAALVRPLLVAAGKAGRELYRDAVDADGWPALHRAAAGGHARVVAALLEEGAQLEQQNAKDGRRALHVAAIEGHIEAVTLLLDCSAEPEARDKTGHSALELALVAGRSEAALKLDPDCDLLLDDELSEASLRRIESPLAADVAHAPKVMAAAAAASATTTNRATAVAAAGTANADDCCVGRMMERECVRGGETMEAEAARFKRSHEQPRRRRPIVYSGSEEEDE